MSRVALPIFLFILLTAQLVRAQDEMPAFQLPFASGQLWQIDSYDATHAPALDMVRDPDSDRDTTEGQPVLAPADGTVNQSFYHNNAGNTIQINHGGGWFTTYLHLQGRDVEEGATVSQGEQIGRVGHTGPTSNGTPHLHYELAIDSNGDGEASWGETESERVPAWFDGVEYGAETGETHNNVASNNCTNPSTKFWVDTFAAATGYPSPTCFSTGEACPPQGTLQEGTHYVFCRAWGSEVRNGDDYNHWWLWTDLDEVAPGGSSPAWVSAYYLSRWGNDEAKDNDGAEIPNCIEQPWDR
jgi:hypothetical protein